MLPIFQSQFPIGCAEDRATLAIGNIGRRLPMDEKERRILELEKENSELKRVNEILKDALGFFAESRRK